MLMELLDIATQIRGATATVTPTAIATATAILMNTHLHQPVGMDTTNRAAKETTTTSPRGNTRTKGNPTGTMSTRELIVLVYRLAPKTVLLMPAMETTASISNQSAESLQLRSPPHQLLLVAETIHYPSSALPREKIVMSIGTRAIQHGITILGIPTKDLKSTAVATPVHTTGTTELRNTQVITKAKAIAFQSPAANTTKAVNTQGSTDLAQPMEPKRAAST